MWLARIDIRLRSTAILVAALAMVGAQPAPAHAAGRIDANTLLVIPHGTFGGVKYVRYEALFQGVASSGNGYRVPCQIIAPALPENGSGLLLFDWLNRTTIFAPIGREMPIGRFALNDEFLFGMGASYATVRCDPAGI